MVRVLELHIEERGPQVVWLVARGRERTLNRSVQRWRVYELGFACRTLSRVCQPLCPSVLSIDCRENLLDEACETGLKQSFAKGPTQGRSEFDLSGDGRGSEVNNARKEEREREPHLAKDGSMIP